MGWRLRSGWVDHQLRVGNNPHPWVCVREASIDYWNFRGDHGAGYLIFYDIRMREAYVFKQGRRDVVR